MKKILLGGVAALGLVLMVFPKAVRASEGITDLRGSGTSGACFASSIFIDGNYKVMVTCRDLKTALSPERNRYVLWIEDEAGGQRRMGEIVAGKFFGQVDQKFVKLFVTVERDSYVNKPSEDVLLTGNVRDIDFGPGMAPATAVVTPTPTPVRGSAPRVVEQNEDITPAKSGLTSALGTIFKIVLLGFGALLIVVGVSSFMSRRRSL